MTAMTAMAATGPYPGKKQRSIASPDQEEKPRIVKMLALATVAVIAATLVLPYVAHAAASASAGATPAPEPLSIVSLVKSSMSFILHLDVHLGDIIARFGLTTYAILFAIVFAETGLVITPLLPGDSLLFATGALAALGKLNIVALLTVYAVAATLGDAVNYTVGKYLGSKAMGSKLVKKEYLEKTEEFYSTYGGKTIVLARFVPIGTATPLHHSPFAIHPFCITKYLT